MKDANTLLLEAAEDMLRFVEAGHAGAGHALDCVYVGLRDVVNDIRGRHYGEAVPKQEPLDARIAAEIERLEAK